MKFFELGLLMRKVRKRNIYPDGIWQSVDDLV